MFIFFNIVNEWLLFNTKWAIFFSTCKSFWVGFFYIANSLKQQCMKICSSSQILTHYPDSKLLNLNAECFPFFSKCSFFSFWFKISNPQYLEAVISMLQGLFYNIVSVYVFVCYIIMYLIGDLCKHSVFNILSIQAFKKAVPGTFTRLI